MIHRAKDGERFYWDTQTRIPVAEEVLEYKSTYRVSIDGVDVSYLPVVRLEAGIRGFATFFVKDPEGKYAQTYGHPREVLRATIKGYVELTWEEEDSDE